MYKVWNIGDNAGHGKAGAPDTAMRPFKRKNPPKNNSNSVATPKRRGTGLTHPPGLVLARCPALQREQATYTHCCLLQRKDGLKELFRAGRNAGEAKGNRREEHAIAASSTEQHEQH